MSELDLSSILNSLTPDDIANLQKTAESILGGSSGDGQSNKEQNTMPNKNNTNANNVNVNPLDMLSSLGMPDMSQLNSIMPILQMLNAKDERVEFINAMKPLLSDERQKKADEAMKLVKIMSLIPLLRERGII